jgi:hypothetical protein
MAKAAQEMKEAAERKRVTIIVNGRPKETTEKELTFEDLIELAYENPPSGPNVMFTITFAKGEGNKSGTLAPGESVKVKNDMVFGVTATDRS